MIELPSNRELEVVYPFLSRPPQWLILAGLGEGNEAMLARGKWPGVRILGADPDPRAIAWQRERGWRDTDILLEIALSDDTDENDRKRDVYLGPLGSATLHPYMVVKAPQEDIRPVRTVTLNELNVQHGPFADAVLWVDAEGYDHKIIRGASDFLTRGVMVIATEVWTARPDLLFETDALRAFLRCNGFRMLETFGVQWWGHNEVFVAEWCLREVKKWG